MDYKTKFSREKAEDLYLKAKDELCKPEEDVVPYSVCRNAYYSITNYLGSYLSMNGVKLSESDSVEDLLNKCRTVDKRFNDLHLSPLYNPTETEDVWMNLDTANDYIKMAESTRQIFSRD
ncbi:MAG: hypothetical protein R3345_04035 [Fulvivirga sp.]|nr:hypothetical protein [Fulvivirga sp.]